MTAPSEPRLKITYATLRNDNDQLHASFDAGLETARGELGGTHGIFIDGEWRPAKETFEKRSPIDGSLVGHFAKGTREDVCDAIAAARAAAPGWAGTPWRERVSIMRRLADQGNTVLVIEHNLDIIKCADYVIDLGPEGGSGGGRIIASGTVEKVALEEQSSTGQFLRKVIFA